MNVQIEDSWKAHLQPEFDKDYFYTLTNFVREEYGKYAIYPPGKLIFNAFNLCPFDKVKVVIIGQDPYHGPGPAGRNKAYYCSMPPSQYVPIRPAPIKTTAGKHLRMPPSASLPKNVNIWSSYYGELMRNEKAPL